MLERHPDNPHRLRWRGKAVFLLGSTEHYGAVLNAAFEQDRYLATIAADRLNLSRIFCFFRENEASLGGQLGYANTLAPRPEQYLAPWPRAEGAAPAPDGLPRFDLDRWDDRYFRRLRDFVEAAGQRGVAVEVTLFCNQYRDEDWRNSPLHPAGNVNGVGAGATSYRDFLTLSDATLAETQRRFVRKVVAELRGADNIYYEICNEPTLHRGEHRSDPDPAALHVWHREIIRVLREAELGLGSRHLVAVNPHMNLPLDADAAMGRMLDDGFYRGEPEIDLLNVHYISQREPRAGLAFVFPERATQSVDSHRFGAIASFVALRAGAGKPIGFDEDYTGIVHGAPVQPWQNRMEAWESLIGGCASYDHLDFTFTTDDPTGSAAGALPGGMPGEWFDGRAPRHQLGHLAAYAAELELGALRPDLLAVVAAPLGSAAVAARAGDGVVVYLADPRPFGRGFGGPVPAGRLVLQVRPGARYPLTVLDPRTGERRTLAPATADGSGLLAVEVPTFREDLVVEAAR